MRLTLLVLAATGALLTWLINSTPALACSAGPDYDPVDESTLIVGGRIANWQVVEAATTYDPKSEPAPTDDPDFYGPYTPIRLTMAVDKVYKGSAAAEIQMVTGNTLDRRDGIDYWVGSSGSCGAFDWDPTGQYWILGLRQDEFGRLRPGLLMVFLKGTEDPGGHAYDDAVAHLESSLGPASLPTSGAAGDSGPQPAPLAIAVFGLALAAAGALTVRRAAHNRS